VPIEASFEEPATFYWLVWGTCSHADCHGAIRGLLADERLGPRTALFVRSQRVTALPRASELISLAVDWRPVAHRGLKRIAVVLDDAFVQTTAKMVASLLHIMGTTLKVFETDDDARYWLRTGIVPR
jgi:hypothetical protein